MQTDPSTLLHDLVEEHARLEARARALGPPEVNPRYESELRSLTGDLRSYCQLTDRSLGRILRARAPDTPVAHRLRRCRERLDEAIDACFRVGTGSGADRALRMLREKMTALFALERRYVFPATHYLMSPATLTRIEAYYSDMKRIEGSSSAG